MTAPDGGGRGVGTRGATASRGAVAAVPGAGRRDAATPAGGADVDARPAVEAVRRERLDPRLRSALVALALPPAGLLAGVALLVAAVLAAAALSTPLRGEALDLAAELSVLVGLAAAAALGLPRGAARVRVDAPTARDLGYAAAAAVAALLATAAVLAAPPVALGVVTTGRRLLVVTAVPVVEELLFRGAVQTRLAPLGVASAVVAAALFALAHVAFAAGPADRLARVAASAFLGGLAYGLAYRRTGNLAVPVLAHAAYNAATLAGLH